MDAQKSRLGFCLLSAFAAHLASDAALDPVMNTNTPAGTAVAIGAGAVGFLAGSSVFKAVERRIRSRDFWRRRAEVLQAYRKIQPSVDKALEPYGMRTPRVGEFGVSFLSQKSSLNGSVNAVGPWLKVQRNLSGTERDETLRHEAAHLAEDADDDAMRSKSEAAKTPWRNDIWKALQRAGRAWPSKTYGVSDWLADVAEKRSERTRWDARGALTEGFAELIEKKAGEKPLEYAPWRKGWRYSDGFNFLAAVDQDSRLGPSVVRSLLESTERSDPPLPTVDDIRGGHQAHRAYTERTFGVPVQPLPGTPRHIQ